MNVRMEMMMPIYLYAIIADFSVVILIVVFQLLRRSQSRIGIANSAYLRLEEPKEEEGIQIQLQTRILRQVEEIVDQIKRQAQVQVQEPELGQDLVETREERILLDRVHWIILLWKTSQEIATTAEQQLKLKKNLQGPIQGQIEIGETLQIER